MIGAYDVMISPVRKPIISSSDYKIKFQIVASHLRCCWAVQGKGDFIEAYNCQVYYLVSCRSLNCTPIELRSANFYLH